MKPERRRSPRVAEQVSVVITDADHVIQADTKNLSTSGAYCTLDRFIAPMTKLQLAFELPNGTTRDRVRCTGVVVRAEPVVSEAQRGRYHIAIFFTDLAARDRAAIGRFVQRRLAAAPSTN